MSSSEEPYSVLGEHQEDNEQQSSSANVLACRGTMGKQVDKQQVKSQQSSSAIVPTCQGTVGAHHRPRSYNVTECPKSIESPRRTLRLRRPRNFVKPSIPQEWKKGLWRLMGCPMDNCKNYSDALPLSAFPPYISSFRSYARHLKTKHQLPPRCPLVDCNTYLE
jgi:hypothetical protein